MTAKKILLSAALFCACFFGFLSDAAAAELTVLATSDVHGQLTGWDYFNARPAPYGLSRVSTLVNLERQANPDATLLLDGGDFLQGTPLDSYYATVEKNWSVHPVLAAFNAMQYDAIVVGNHEFNFGLAFFAKAMRQNANLLSANIIETKSGKVWSNVKPYLIKEVLLDGERVKVGIIGVTTPAVPNFENAQNYQGLSFQDQAATVKKYVAELKRQGVDLIIAASHSGVESKTRPGAENQVAAIAAAAPELSLIIAAHDHVLIDNQHGIKDGKEMLYPDAVINGVPVMATKNLAQSLAKAKLEIVKQEGHWKVIKAVTANIMTNDVAEDEKIVKLIEPYHAATLKFLNEKIGEASGDFSGERAALEDSALIDLVNETQRHFGKAQLAAAASFNPKAQIMAGDIKRQHVASLYVYENYLYTISVTGAQLKLFLEKAAEQYGQKPDYNYDMVQGVEYLIDLSKPLGERITLLKYQGKDVRPEDVCFQPGDEQLSLQRRRQVYGSDGLRCSA